MIPLGTKAANFELIDTVINQPLALCDVRGQKGLVVMFICNHCPYVKHIHSGLTALGKDYDLDDIGIIAISANDAYNYPEDGPAEMKKLAVQLKLSFPYLYDKNQSTAKAYGAVCTPEFFVFDKNLACVYRGQFDDSRPGNGKPVTGSNVRAAMNAVITGQPVAEQQTPAIGCGIKWRL